MNQGVTAGAAMGSLPRAARGQTVPMDPAAPGAPPPAAPGAVLSTLLDDGRRRWIDPRPSPGRFLRRRRLVALLLIALFTALPFVRVGGKPALLLDVAAREFTFFGATFLPTDTLLLALLLLAVFVAVFLATALLGRVWCGWACPQTVYMEFVFRPIERLLRGDAAWRRAARYALYLLVCVYLANTFLAYFVGVDRLQHWITRPPGEHPAAFLVMAVVTLLMMVDFTYAREQMCTLMCPYGRFQSVLLDAHSLIVGYDAHRGEPRGPLRKAAADASRGDCVDCRKCVATCPTGIDIRDGLQMECVACAQCIDACDDVMARIGKPRGLIRYTSTAALAGGTRRVLRPRVILYPLALTVLLIAFGAALQRRDDVDVTFLRVRATPYRVLEDGRVTNPVGLKLTNRCGERRGWQLSLAGDGELLGVDGPIELDPRASATLDLQVVLPPERFTRGRAAIQVEVRDERGRTRSFEHVVLGPLFAGGRSP